MLFRSASGTVTVDASGNLALTSSGEIAFNGNTTSLQVTVVDGSNTNQIRIYSTINGALTDTALTDNVDTSVGGGSATVGVAAGTYEESLTLNNAVKLAGANASLAGSSSSRSSDNEAQINGNITVSSPDVSISGFQFTTGSITATAAGDNLTVTNNIFDSGQVDARLATAASNVTVTGNSISVSGFGVAVQNATSGAVSDNKIIVSGGTAANEIGRAHV